MRSINHVCVSHDNASPDNGISRIDSLPPVASWSLTKIPRTSPRALIKHSRQGDNIFIAKFHTDNCLISSSILCVNWQPSCSSKIGFSLSREAITDLRVVEEYETPLVGQQDVFFFFLQFPFALNFSCPNDDLRPAFNHYLCCPFLLILPLPCTNLTLKHEIDAAD